MGHTCLCLGGLFAFYSFWALRSVCVCVLVGGWAFLHTMGIHHAVLLKGHERSITQLKYNREGDLLFTCAKDNKPTAWFSSNGERLGA